MILSDRDLRAEIEAGRLVIEPFDETAVQPSSIDLRAGNEFRVFVNHRYPHIDVREPLEHLTEVVKASEDEPFILHPGEFVLGSTLESVTLPDNLVARLEGKSSLGRLGLLIHSSLPGDETIPFLRNQCLTQIPIQEIVRKQLNGFVISFDPESFRISYHEVTGWHETPPDRIFEVTLASGRRVRLTGGHALFSLDRDGELVRVRVHELIEGSRVAIAGAIPEPSPARARLDLVALAAEADYPQIVCGGDTIALAFERDPRGMADMLREAGIHHVLHYRNRAILPLTLALQRTDIAGRLGSDDWLAPRGGQHRLPAVIEVDKEFAWLLGLYVAEGYRRDKQVTISNTDRRILDRAQGALAALGLPVYRGPGAITCCSGLLSKLIQWLGVGDGARRKRIPRMTLGWPNRLLESFLEGFVDGDGSRESTRVSLWTSSEDLVGDLLLLCARLGKRAGASVRDRGGRNLWQVSIPHREHKLLASVPICDRLLVDVRAQAGLTQKDAARVAGFKHATQLNNLERRAAAVHLATLRRLRAAYSSSRSRALPKLGRLVDGDLRWDAVAHIRDTGTAEPVFDLEVRPSGHRIENFLAGRGGVLVSNTAGFVDAGFSGQLTLELSNVATLPIAIYPGMRIGQLCLFQMSSPAERPYGSSDVGSKYQGQKGPTASRYHENF